MAEKLTPQQALAVNNRGGALLVSAAAGSGKTKVLVDRLLSYILDPVNPANLDDFLIITFTEAAAAELRGKIAAKLAEKIAQQPDNRHLRKQMQRLYVAQISTVHAFCSQLLRSYAYRLDIPGDFRIASENDCTELQSKAFDMVMEQFYAQATENPDFCAFIDSHSLKRDDSAIADIIIKLYKSIMCYSNPEQWLEECVAATDVRDLTDASQTVWGKYLIADLQQYLQQHIQALQGVLRAAEVTEGFEKPVALLHDTVSQLEQLRACNSWDDICKYADIDYGKLLFPKAATDSQLKEEIKAIRKACKEGLQKKLCRFADESARIFADIENIASATKGLVSLIRAFHTVYSKLKRARKVLDFDDLEHCVLDLVQGKSRSGSTAIAREIGDKYREVMVDEYQDTNEVQDAIFAAITDQRHNIFMVGDVKQAIYGFRMADPGIFLDKYNRYAPAQDAADGEGRKVILSSNFRSGPGVIEGANDVFSKCMSPEVGGLVYGEEEMLREGIPHVILPEPEVELYGIRVEQDAYCEEAAFVADKILQLLDGSHMVRDGENLRPITPGDIVILLRSPGVTGAIFSRALNIAGIPYYSEKDANLLEEEEIVVLRSLLQVIDNPLHDISLVSVLASRVFGFTADDLAAIRGKNRAGSFYDALRQAEDKKSKKFLEVLAQLRNDAKLLNLVQLMDRIFVLTHMDSIYSALPGGETRLENIHAFCQIAASFESIGQYDVARFLHYLDTLDEEGIKFTGKKDSGNAVTITSIHKSKGLEYPVVILSGLAKAISNKSLEAQVYFHKDLGLGLNCVDEENRIKYPSIAKNAIAVHTLREERSAEMRLLYVAMTRARDRLIMTYASKYLDKRLTDLALRARFTDPALLMSETSGSGEWVLYSALSRTEAGELSKIADFTVPARVFEHPWKVEVCDAAAFNGEYVGSFDDVEYTEDDSAWKIKDSLAFVYPFQEAVKAPSKMTATQIKGRAKDMEAAQDAKVWEQVDRSWRKPDFVEERIQGKTYGSAIHAVMQFICFKKCHSEAGVEEEIQRLISAGYISAQQAAMADSKKIAKFFASPLGCRLRQSENVLREFKFSILDDATKYTAGAYDEKVLLQGVVDCALIEEDGITIVDFKTNQVSEETLPATVRQYEPQVNAYADALCRIFEKPVKKKLLYFFAIDRFVEL